MQREFVVTSDFKPAGDQPAAIVSLVDGLRNGLRYQTLLGVTGSGKTFTMAHVIQEIQKPVIILAPNKTLAGQLYSEMKEFFPRNAVEYFVSYYDYYQPEAYVPTTDTYIEKDASINEQIEQMRLSATKSLLERKDVIIVATVSAIYGLGDPSTYLSMVLQIKKNDIIEQRDILNQLATMQYTRNDVAFSRGNYRVRGDVIDIFPADAEKDAVRICLLGDEIDEIALFDPLTGKILQKVTRFMLFPKSHYVTPREKILKAVDTIKAELKIRLDELYAQNKLVEWQRLGERTRYDLEMMLELGYCSGIENYSRHLTQKEPGEEPPTLLHYLPKDSLLIVDESHVTIPQLGAMYKGDRARKENLVNYGFRLPSALDNRPLKFEEFEKIAPQMVFVSATPSVYEEEHAKNIAEQIVRPTGLIDPMIEIRSARSQVDDVLSEIREVVSKGERVLITTLTKRMSEDLTTYLSEHRVRVRYLHSDIETLERAEILRDLRLGKFDVLVGINLLREGLDLPEVSLVAIFDADKEGFLRSTRSLIQTIGRAARNLNGRAILYAEVITNSMQRAIDETDRRRNKQIEHNKIHNITPESIRKNIRDSLDTSSVVEEKEEAALHEVMRALKINKREALTQQDKLRAIKELEKKMKELAANLDFEQAAQVRDEIRIIKDTLFF